MAHELEDVDEYWASFRKPYTASSEAVQPTEAGDRHFSQEELEHGLLAIRALRAEQRLMPGNLTPRPIVRPSEVAELNRSLRAGLGVPEDLGDLGIMEGVQDEATWYRNTLLRNLEVAFRMLGFQCTPTVETDGRLQIIFGVDRSSSSFARELVGNLRQIQINLTPSDSDSSTISDDPIGQRAGTSAIPERRAEPSETIALYHFPTLEPCESVEGRQAEPSETVAMVEHLRDELEAHRANPQPVIREIPFNRYDNRLSNLVESLRVLGFRSEVWVDGAERIHITLPDVQNGYWSTSSLDEGGVQLVIRHPLGGL
jgi:hypothetical protein